MPQIGRSVPSTELMSAAQGSPCKSLRTDLSWRQQIAVARRSTATLSGATYFVWTMGTTASRARGTAFGPHTSAAESGRSTVLVKASKQEEQPYRAALRRI